MRRISKWLHHRLSNLVDTERFGRKGNAMMTRKLHHTLVSTLFGFVLTMCALLHPAMGQAAPAQGQSTPTQQQQSSSKPSQIRPVSLAHLYWHFLVFQNHLDTKAADLGAHGKNGRLMHNHLQKKLGFSDADYAAIRTSSVRLTAKVKVLDAKATAIQKAGASSSSHDQLKALTVQREADINSEIAYLKQNLPPDKIKAFEAFLTQLFSPTNAVFRPSLPVGKPAPTAVQK